ncbi:aspartate/glutamate racemase family protein [Deinococcus yavapaiensis]|uniref:Aspartate racemase n=1 Tax=Deinococcus yavapaiensis KR-236 TaxID=694435 RepID=A0A318ST89_9DEIO|nr:aspartate/glutamate racemase family protein [Deinococcus yavapaiensis]PYE56436.1 aspartate racemase [Deinococcus yavapaiensis KR-236]
MRRIGLIGGMSWESTLLYYRLVNQMVRDELGGLKSADLVLHSLDFDAVAALQRAERWDEAGRMLGDAGAGLARAGAQTLLICTNTMHLVADEVERRSGVPVIHIADVTANAAKKAGVTRLGLLATAFTMERPFYRDRLESHGLEVLVPCDTARAEVHRVIFEELCRGVVREESKAAYLQAARELIDRGAQGLILGCTEICMLISQADFDVPVFDTTELHARAAVAFALQDERVAAS